MVVPALHKLAKPSVQLTAAQRDLDMDVLMFIEFAGVRHIFVLQ